MREEPGFIQEFCARESLIISDANMDYEALSRKLNIEGELDRCNIA